MSRGIRSVWTSPSGAGTPSLVNLASVSINLATTNLVASGWMRILGPEANGLRGHIPFQVKDISNVWETFFYADYASASPFTMQMNVINGTSTNYGSWSVATGEDWFYVIMWDASAQTWIGYAAKDGAVSMGSPATSAAGGGIGTVDTVYVGGHTFNFDWGCNVECTDFCLATPATLPNAIELLAQMKSDPITYVSPYARLQLLNSSVLTDSTGNSHAGSIVGTITDALLMDPVDLHPIVTTPINIKLHGHH